MFPQPRPVVELGLMPEQPQPWDTAKVAAAFADAIQLSEALASDQTADAYRAALIDVLDRYTNVDTLDELRDQLAYLIYGLTVFSMGALETAQALGNLSRREALA